ncbi:MAG: polysaccharide pyruvyl transferase CsaB [Synergistaceae bacterium]|jgi:polysaccharide pyruvyl transferase CsaB|nr:polysaccharide pyruvyl transferase CsaB [Synergistaceae bacterium]
MSGGAKAFDVLLAGYFGFGNLGDELLAEAAVKNLSSCGIPPERISILSNRPSESLANFGISSFDRWKITDIARALDMSRSMLFAGGGLFQDTTSVRSCVYYWGLIWTARLKSVPVAAVGQSVGPLAGSFSKLLTKDALKKCKYIAVRDDASAEVASAMNIACEVMPDPVMSIEIPENEGGEDVLVNIRPVAGGGYDAARAVLDAVRVLDADGAKLLCVAMSKEDARLMEKLRESRSLPECEIVTPRNAGEFFGIARRARAAIGMRLHFGILSMLSGLDVVLAPYDPKVSSFARAWELKLLKIENIAENFDIIKLLTKSKFGDKRNFEKIRLLVFRQFETALDRMLGECDE